MRVFAFLLFATIHFFSWSQVGVYKSNERHALSTYVEKIVFFGTSSSVNWPKDVYKYQHKKVIFLPIKNPDDDVLIHIYMKGKAYNSFLKINNTSNYQIIDSLVYVNNAYYSTKIRWKDFFKSNHFYLHLEIKNNKKKNFNIDIIPIMKTEASIEVENNNLYLGEVKSFPLLTNNIKNIIPNPLWVDNQTIKYRIVNDADNKIMQVRAEKDGIYKLNYELNLKFPWMDKDSLYFKTTTKEVDFQAKKMRLNYINITPNTFFLKQTDNPFDVKVGYNSKLKLNTIYRVLKTKNIESQLVAEFYLTEIIGNDYILGKMRTYGTHHKKKGQLYVNEGTKVRFITNIDIIPEVNIQKIQVHRKGKNWENSNFVFPGEKLEIKIIGKSLQYSSLQFDGLKTMTTDSLRNNASVMIFTGKIDQNINKKEVNILNAGKKTGHKLIVKEFQSPHVFDFLQLKTKDTSLRVDSLAGEIMIPYSSKDILLQVNNSIIDNKSLYGKQYLNLDVELRTKSGQIYDKKSIKKLTICPDISSVRYPYYDKKDCNKTKTYSLNSYLRTKIYQLPPWSKISLKIEHDKSMYSEKKVSQNVDIYLQQKVGFDINVSFPAGLVVKKFGKTEFENLSGISLAIIAQLSFYHPEKISTKRPYRIGTGFLAFNAFNFSESNTTRDVGVVILGSLYPIQRFERKKLSFPLYFGAGYFLSKAEWFLMFGPGIRVRL